MEPTEVCKQIIHQFDATTQGHLAILGSIVLNVVVLIRVWLTSRDAHIEAKSVNRKLDNMSGNL